MFYRIHFISLFCLALVHTTQADISKQLTDEQLLSFGTSVQIAERDLVSNPEAPIPPQCYTKTESQFNPCYTCHQSYDEYNASTRTNFMRDGGLQGRYEFSEIGTINHWKNLFKDRTAEVASISDKEILDYINTENYSAIVDISRSVDFRNWAPDLTGFEKGRIAFDEYGHALDGSGWVAFNYKPLPSTFWPTNGSTDDVLIRLPESFQITSNGRESRDIYQANLALLEMSILGLESLSVPEIDESLVGVDLDGTGELSKASIMIRRENYVGAAAQSKVVNLLYPEGTEFMHSVRYVGIDADGKTEIPERMKELRYMKKIAFKSAAKLRSVYINERQEKTEEQLPSATVAGTALAKDRGWVFSAYIEDAKGELRQQTYEETFFCTGCHSSIGTTIDSSFAFARKVAGAKGWGYIDLKKLEDVPSRGESQGEYLTYLQRVGGGSEFRNNTEMQQRWFKEPGVVDEEKVLRSTLFDLITPSRERALQLNKAYRVIVKEQSYHHGRDATVTPPMNVYEKIENHTAPLDKKYMLRGWDIRQAVSSITPKVSK